MRAHLARLLVHEPDLLMLDEPTNHLDLEALLWFQTHLQNYPGAILLISHDREFLDAIVGSIVEIRQSRLIRYRGNYEDYLVQREAGETQLARETLEQLTLAFEAPDSLRQRAQIALSVLGPAPATEETPADGAQAPAPSEGETK